MLSCSGQTFDTIYNAGVLVANAFNNEMKNVLPSFMPGCDTPLIVKMSTSWLEAVWQALARVLKPALRNDFDGEALVRWVRSTESSCVRLEKAMHLVILFKPMVVQTDPLLKNVCAANAVVVWLKKAGAFLQAGKDSTTMNMHQLKAVQKAYHEAITSTPFVLVEGSADTICEGYQDFLCCPLLEPDGAYNESLKSLLHAHGATILDPFVRHMKDLFPLELPLRLFSCSASSDEGLAAGAGLLRLTK